MKRREFITLLGGAAAWPLEARAQQPAKLPTIGFLGGTTASTQSEWTAAFVQRLRELGWIEGRTVAIEYRWAEGRGDRAAKIAIEFVRLNVNVIITGGTAPIIASKQATSIIPIVFATAGDPVGAGLVASLARPGGTSLAFLFWRPISRARKLNFCASLCRPSAGWQSWPMSAALPACYRWVKLWQRPVHSGSKLSQSKSE